MTSQTAVYDFKKMFGINFLTEEDCKKLSDEELIEILKNSSDFEKLPFPTQYYKKFPDLPEATCMNTKEYIKESPWMKKHEHFYLPSKPILIEAKPGGNRPILPAPEVPVVTVIKNTFSDADDINVISITDQTVSECPPETQ